MSLTLLFNKLCISCLRDTCLCLALLRLTATPVLILKLKHIVLQEHLQKKKNLGIRADRNSMYEHFLENPDSLFFCFS